MWHISMHKIWIYLHVVQKKELCYRIIQIYLYLQIIINL